MVGFALVVYTQQIGCAITSFVYNMGGQAGRCTWAGRQVGRQAGRSSRSTQGQCRWGDRQADGHTGGGGERDMQVEGRQEQQVDTGAMQVGRQADR